MRFSRHTRLGLSSVQTPRCLCLADLVVSLGLQAFSSGICAFGLQLFCVFNFLLAEVSFDQIIVSLFGRLA